MCADICAGSGWFLYGLLRERRLAAIQASSFCPIVIGYYSAANQGTTWPNFISNLHPLQDSLSSLSNLVLVGNSPLRLPINALLLTWLRPMHFMTPFILKKSVFQKGFTSFYWQTTPELRHVASRRRPVRVSYKTIR